MGLGFADKFLMTGAKCQKGPVKENLTSEIFKGTALKFCPLGQYVNLRTTAIDLGRTCPLLKQAACYVILGDNDVL